MLKTTCIGTIRPIIVTASTNQLTLDHVQDITSHKAIAQLPIQINKAKSNTTCEVSSLPDLRACEAHDLWLDSWLVGLFSWLAAWTVDWWVGVSVRDLGRRTTVGE